MGKLKQEKCSLCESIQAVNVEGNYWLCGACIWDKIKSTQIPCLNCAELQAIFDMGYKQTKKANKAWQKAHNKPDVWPGLGQLIGWLMEEAKINRRENTCSRTEKAYKCALVRIASDKVFNEHPIGYDSNEELGRYTYPARIDFLQKIANDVLKKL